MAKTRFSIGSNSDKVTAILMSTSGSLQTMFQFVDGKAAVISAQKLEMSKNSSRQLFDKWNHVPGDDRPVKRRALSIRLNDARGPDIAYTLCQQSTFLLAKCN